MEGTFKSPRPIPNIVTEASFSHRKPKKGPHIRKFEEDCLPPRAPVKSAPPVSRVFRHTRRGLTGPLQVSFRENGSSILLKFVGNDFIPACCSVWFDYWALFKTLKLISQWAIRFTSPLFFEHGNVL